MTSLTPSVEAEVKVKTQNANEFLELAKNYEITCQEDTAFAAQMLTESKGMYKEIDSQRKGMVDPLNGVVKKINALFKPALDSLASIELVWKQKLSQAKAESDRQAQAALAAASEAAKAGDTQALTLALATHDDAANAPVAAGIQYRTKWSFRVTDPTQIPREYLIVDERALQALATGLKERAVVPGVEFFAETVIAARG